MTDKERLSKLKQAESLIREVEFSYPVGHAFRQRMFCVVVNTFGLLGSLSFIIEDLKAELKKEKI